MRVALLGTAAGGGFPQWNCACRMCTSDAPAREGDCIAVSADGSDWFLVNASPDIRSQILATPALAAGPGPRDTPIKGALLTDAELDHAMGLLTLRGAAGLRVHAPEAVLHALRDGFGVHGITERYAPWEWAPVPPELGGLRVSALPVSDKVPKYCADTQVPGPWVVAYRFEDPATGGVLVYAPCLRTWPEGFDEFCAGAACVLLDGTFYSAGEMSGATHAGVGSGAQRAMGHVPIAGPEGSLARIGAHRAAHPGVRWIYTHLNNTNLVLDPSSAEYHEVLAAGAEVLPDGAELVL